MSNSMNTNTHSTSKWDEYLKSLRAEKGSNITHTRIGSKDLNIYGGSYNIENLSNFWDKYYHHVFVAKNKEYLTEKQLIENGPLLVDIDLRYDTSIKIRQHNKDHIIDLIVFIFRQVKMLTRYPISIINI